MRSSDHDHDTLHGRNATVEPEPTITYCQVTWALCHFQACLKNLHPGCEVKQPPCKPPCPSRYVCTLRITHALLSAGNCERRSTAAGAEWPRHAVARKRFLLAPQDVHHPTDGGQPLVSGWEQCSSSSQPQACYVAQVLNLQFLSQ